MKAFKSGDRITTIIDNEVKHGVIKRTYLDMNILIVELDDGNTVKLRADKVLYKPNTETQPEAEVEAEEKKTETPTGAKRIPESKYLELLDVVTRPEWLLENDLVDDLFSGIIQGASVHIVGMNLCAILYKDAKEIEITAEQLREKIFVNSAPSVIAEIVGGKMSEADVLPISIFSVLVLENLAVMLFDEAKND